jgi:hypothetical protein
MHINLDWHATLEKLFGIEKTKVYAVVGEFADGPDLVKAGRAVKDAGYTKLDAMSPFPVHGIDDAIGVPTSHLGWIVIWLSAAGAALAQLLQWYTGAGQTGLLPAWTGLGSYPQVIGGKPLYDWTFSIPVTFELTVLLSAFAALIGMFALNGLPRMYHPLDNYSQSHRATDDAFFLVIESKDPKFDPENSAQLLRSLGARNVEVVEG